MGFKFTKPEDNAVRAGNELVDSGGPISNRGAADFEAWEHSARGNLLHQLPLRASLIGLMGAGLSAGAPIPSIAAITNTQGVCSVEDETDTINAMADLACLSVLIDEPITLTKKVAVTKPIDLRNTITMDAGAPYGQLLIESGTVSISGVDTTTSVIMRGTSTNTLIEIDESSTSSVHVTLSGLRLDGYSSSGTLSLLQVSSSTHPGSLTLHSVDILNNKSSFGSSVQIADGGLETLTIDTTRFMNNVTSRNYVGGGALYLRGIDSVQVISSVFVNNTATEEGGSIFAQNVDNLSVSSTTFDSNTSTSQKGGAVYAIDSSVSVSDTLFLRNRAQDDGGAIWQRRGNLGVSEASVFSLNYARDNGGAIYVDQVLSFVVSDSRFTDNTARDIGGALVVDSSTASIHSSSFTGNSTIRDEGGAIYIDDDSIVDVSNSLFDGNTAGTHGGAVSVDDISLPGPSVTVSDSTLVGNSAMNGDGGAIRIRGGVLVLENSTLALNSATLRGGAVGFYGSSLEVQHTTIAFNNAGGVGGGAAVDPYDGSNRPVSVSHSLFVANSGAGTSQDFHFGFAPSSLVWDFSISSTQPNFFNLPPLTQVPVESELPSAGTWTPGSAVSIFGTQVLEENGGPTRTLALQTTSPNPALNSGDPGLRADAEGVPVWDQRGTGFSRISGGRIDIGAFEVQAVAAPPVTETPAPRPVEPLLPSVIPSLAISDATLTCTIGEFSDAPEFVDVTLVVGGVRQETRRIAMPATTVTWPVDSLWRGQSVGCEVVARVENRVATAYAPGISIPSATTPAPTPTPTPTTPTPTTPAEPARGFAATSIRFAPLFSALDAADRRAIASLLEQAGIDATFRVTGYVQAVGSTRNDRALSLARAQAVAAELRRLGVAASNITAIGGGRSQRDGAAARRATITARWTK